MIRKATAVLIVMAALGGCATSATAPGSPVADASMGSPDDNKLPGYLAAGLIDSSKVLGPPPAPDSPRGKSDQAIFEADRALQGTPRWKEAQVDSDLWNGGALRRFACAVGRDVTPTVTPVTLRLLHRVEMDVRTVSSPAKSFYNRRRPLIGNTKPICVPREAWMETNGSYPSGHSMTGWTWSLVLAELQPERTTQLLEAGLEAGRSRVICGVHYESDVEAGRTLAAGMVARLHAEPAFLADMAAARRELAAAPLAAGCGA